MTKSSSEKPDPQNWLRGEYIIYGGIIWSAITAILYLNFSIIDATTTHPAWFILATTGLEEIGLLIAGCLCLRNWKSPYVPSGSAVWLLFAIAIFAFFGGNLWFCLWEVTWGLDPAASAGNPFFVLFYLMLIAGMRLAILDRDVQLVPQQWLLVVSVAAVGLIIGCWLTTLSAKAMTVSSLATSMEISQTSSNRHQMPEISPLMVSPQLTVYKASIAPASPPEWVISIDRLMQPLINTFNLFYVLCDLVLLIFAAILFLGFWGGRLGLPWRIAAQAVTCFYIADTWFAYANNQVQGYESGSIMEVFWTFGIVQFGIAAALEFDNSIRARRLARRRTAIN